MVSFINFTTAIIYDNFVCLYYIHTHVEFAKRDDCDEGHRKIL